MGDFSNGLSNAEIERLALLSEEAGELVSIVGKILRHGYESYNPDRGELGSNREQLEAEIGDVLFSVELMCLNDDADKWSINAGVEAAMEKKPKYLHHQPLSTTAQIETTEGPAYGFWPKGTHGPDKD